MPVMRYQPQNGRRRLSAYARSLGFTYAWNFGDGSNNPVEVIGNAPLFSQVIGTKIIGGPAGKALQFDGNPDHAYPIVGNPFATAACTYFWIDSGVDNTSNGQAVTHSSWAGSNTGGETGGLQIRILGGEVHVICAQRVDQASGNGRRNDGRMNACAVSVAGLYSAEYNIFINGALTGHSQVGQDYNIAFSHGTSAIGAGADCPSSSVIYYGLLFAPKVIAPADLLYLTNNPWAVWEDDFSEDVVTVAAVGAALSGSGVTRAIASGTLSTSIKLSATAAAVASALGTLSTSVRLAGSAPATAKSSGALSTGIPLAGATRAPTTGTGALSTSIPLSGTAVTPTAASGALAAQAVALAGTSFTRAIASGTLTTSIPLVAGATSPAVSSASLSTSIALAGVANTPTTGTGSLLAQGATLAGTGATRAIASGALSTGISLAGVANTSATAVGTMATNGAALAGTATTAVRASGTLLTTIHMAGLGSTAATATSSLQGGIQLSGTASTRAGAAGALSTSIALSGNAAAKAFAIGALTIPGKVIDASKVPPSRTVRFGGGSRVVPFGGGTRVVVFGGGTRVVVFDVPSIEQESIVANADKPYFKDGKWWVDKDPDEKSYYVADITKELADRATTAESVEVVVGGVSVVEGPEIQGSMVIVKLEGMDVADDAENFWTARVTCANTERFDRTTWLNRVDN